jgi:hypothetical protein
MSDPRNDLAPGRYVLWGEEDYSEGGYITRRCRILRWEGDHLVVAPDFWGHVDALVSRGRLREPHKVGPHEVLQVDGRDYRHV